MLKKVAKDIAAKYLQQPDTTNLEQDIVKHASQHNLNNHQVTYLCNNVNRNIISNMQRGVPSGDYDPHFTFDTVKVANVIGMIRGGHSMRMPTVPQDKPTLPRSPGDSGPSMNIEDYLDKKPDNEGVAVMALEYLKDIAREKRSKYTKIMLKIDDLIRDMQKHAQHHLMSGVPVEVVKSLPAADVLDEAIEDLEGEKLASLDRLDFELDKDSKIYKLGMQIMELRNEADIAKNQWTEAKYKAKRYGRN